MSPEDIEKAKDSQCSIVHDLGFSPTRMKEGLLYEVSDNGCLSIVCTRKELESWWEYIEELQEGLG